MSDERCGSHPRPAARDRKAVHPPVAYADDPERKPNAGETEHANRDVAAIGATEPVSGITTTSPGAARSPRGTDSGRRGAPLPAGTAPGGSRARAGLTRRPPRTSRPRRPPARAAKSRTGPMRRSAAGSPPPGAAAVEGSQAAISAAARRLTARRRRRRARCRARRAAPAPYARCESPRSPRRRTRRAVASRLHAGR